MGAIVSILAIGLVFLCGALAWLPEFQTATTADATGAQAWQEALGDLTGDLDEALSAGAESAKRALQDAAHSLPDSVPGALEQAKQTVSEVANNLRDSAADALESIGEWLGSLRDG